MKYSGARTETLAVRYAERTPDHKHRELVSGTTGVKLEGSASRVLRREDGNLGLPVRRGGTYKDHQDQKFAGGTANVKLEGNAIGVLRRKDGDLGRPVRIEDTHKDHQDRELVSGTTGEVLKAVLVKCSGAKTETLAVWYA